MKKKSSPGRDGSRGSNDRSRPATGRGRAPRNDDRGSRPARSEKKSAWDDFDNSSSRSESGARSSERSGEKRPYQRREDRAESGERRAPFTRGRSDSNDGEKRPYQRREEGSDRGPDSYRDSRGRSSFGDGEKRPYQRRDESAGEKRPYQKREENGERGEGQGMYQRRSEKSEFGPESSEGKRPYKRRDDSEGGFGEKRPYKRSEFGAESSEGKRPYKKRDDSEGGFGEKRSFQRDERGEGSTERRPYGKRPPSRDDRHAKFEEKKHFRDRPAYGKGGGRKSSPRKRSASTGADLTGEIRLNRFIGMAGICSRREADDLITAGVISVNGQVATELGMKVKPGDDIRYNGERIRNEKHVYLLLNKPKDYITTSDDPNDRKTVMELIAGACPERVYPVGRLDRNTVGLLLFTNDGDLARHLTHPSSRVKKIYQAELDKNFKVSDARRLQEGVELEDGISSVDEISIGNAKDDKKVVGVELHSGKNRIVRRLFEALGYDVVKLDRVGFAGLTKKDLPRGRWRMLDEREVGFLKMMGNGKKKQASE